jgi:hypothetical protein
MTAPWYVGGGEAIIKEVVPGDYEFVETIRTQNDFRSKN